MKLEPAGGDAHKNRQATGFLTSSLLLAIVVAMNTELFFFAKTFAAPEWTKPIPDPYFAAGLLVFFSLLPAVFLAKSTFSSVKTLAVTLAVAPIPALLFYGLEVSGDILSNVILQYIWIVVTGCLPSAITAYVASWLIKYSMKQFGGDHEK